MRVTAEGLFMRCRDLNSAVVLSLVLLLGGCDLFGGEDPAKVAAAKEADGKAVGGACRHSGRALEDCYVMNPKASKSAVYAGWRDMDAYMRENNIQAVVPDLVEPPASSKTEKAAGEGDKAAAEKNAAAEEKKPAAEEKKKTASKRGAAFQAPQPARPRRFT
jgi:hypothetical protein